MVNWWQWKRKIGLIVNILRGRPVMYRMHLLHDMGGLDGSNRHAMIMENQFRCGHTDDLGPDG